METWVKIISTRGVETQRFPLREQHLCNGLCTKIHLALDSSIPLKKIQSVCRLRSSSVTREGDTNQDLAMEDESASQSHHNLFYE